MNPNVAHASWRIVGLDCPDCARAVVASVERLKGVVAADLNFASATLVVEYDAAVDPRAAVVQAVQGSGHGVTPLEGAAETPVRERGWLDRNLADVATAGSGTFTILGGALAFGHAPELASVGAYAIAVGFGGLLVWRRAWSSMKARVLDMNILMTVAVFGAAALGDWGEAATVYFLFALGGLLESRALERTRRSIRDLMDLAPPVAHVWRGGAVVVAPVASVLIGDRVLVRPGERIPLDGIVVAGSTAVDQSPVTGESVPAEKTEGDEVFAGTLNTTGLIEVEVTADSEDSTLARIVYLVEEAQASRAPSQQLVDRFSRVYTPVVIALAVAVAVVPPALGALAGWDGVTWSDWFQRALVLLVVSCPCALVISTPVSIVSAITRASRDGVLVKGGAHLETGARVRSVAFDKTGTLTEGRPTVTGVVPLGIDSEELLAVAASLEHGSAHPIARAVARAGDPRFAVGDLVEEPGRGVRGRIDGVAVAIENAAAAARDGMVGEQAQTAVARLEGDGATALVVSRSGAAIGVIGVADAVRNESARVVAALLRDGLEHAVMLTGDTELVTQAVASAAGVDEYMAQLLPADKTAAIGRLRETHGVVAMVGDGINDAPALALADLGIAMGAAGSDTALETADVALMRDDLDALPGFFGLCRRTVTTIRANVAFSIAVKAVFVALAVAGHATLWMAVFADTGVALLVIANGMRLLRPAAA